ncbi:MAG: hypothetical protein CVU06_01200 [Bacteroidetes bacterium HGW-Bacteroidetes-22]|nr:MAG: hypothetical protein CVU06_01200 [Bacteroidetes bacterium HGW-Bacteroidetes-22]
MQEFVKPSSDNGLIQCLSFFLSHVVTSLWIIRLFYGYIYTGSNTTACSRSSHYQYGNNQMKHITYDLRCGDRDSNTFYLGINRFASEVNAHIEEHLGTTISTMISFVGDKSIEQPRSRAEYAVELLTIGMTWSRYLGAAQRTPLLTTLLLQRLFDIRRANQRLKPMADTLRGLISGRCIVPRIGTPAKDSSFSLHNFRLLIRWLGATGEFKDETKRLQTWNDFFEHRQADYVESVLGEVLAVFDWFKEESSERLGKFTTGVGVFLKEKHPAYRHREDVIFCGKQEVEYHLNMVGSEIMNRGFAASYNQTGKKTLLVPGCMRPGDAMNCKASIDGLNITCTGCTHDCRVNRLRQLGLQHDFDVFIVPHSSGFTQWLKRWENSTETGLIAVACLLNLVPGGYEMRELNIPAQCLLLDFCGCRKHWHPQGIVTEINEQRLLELVKLADQREN